MRRYILNLLVVAVLVTVTASCDEWMETKPLLGPEPENIHPESYYDELLVYKQSDHVRSFGWYDGWTGMGLTGKGYLSALPDSMDMVSIWNPAETFAEPLTENQKKDLEKVHGKGMKVLFCLFWKDIGFRMTPGINGSQAGSPSEEYKQAMRENWGWYERTYDGSEDAQNAVRKYAQALANYVIENDYDGIDFDYEVHYGEKGNLVESNAALHVLLDELNKYIGPKSGTGRLICVDGEPQSLNAESGPLIDFYIIQAYYCPGDSDLNSRFDGLYSKFSSQEDEATVLKKLIWTEDFERYSTGENTFTFRSGHKNPGLDEDGSPRTTTPYSVEGMARYYRDINGEVVKVGGFGAYRFNLAAWENDYKLYRWLIQQVNPSNQQNEEE